MTSSKNNGFTAADIERYHSGKMSPEERHALEKAALDDPFLADALEGYAFTSAPANDLSKIQARLDEKLKHKKVVPLFQKHKWLSVAAIVLIIAGAGWLTYMVSNQQRNTVSIAQKQEKTVEHSSPVSPQKTDSVETFKSSVNTSKEVQQDSVPIQSSNSTEKRHQNFRNDEEVIAKAKTPSVDLGNTAKNNSNQLQEVTISKSVSPAQTNQLSSAQPKQAFLENRASRSIPSTDTIKNLSIVLHPLPMDSADLVVMNKGSQKKLKDNYPQVTIDTLEPAEGYTNFDDYVASNLRMPEELKDKPAAGEVQLSFDVDENGKPTNITVVKSLCQKCDEEAIRLLKEGPKWKKKKNKKGKITIKF